MNCSPTPKPILGFARKFTTTSWKNSQSSWQSVYFWCESSIYCILFAKVSEKPIEWRRRTWRSFCAFWDKWSRSLIVESSVEEADWMPTNNIIVDVCFGRNRCTKRRPKLRTHSTHRRHFRSASWQHAARVRKNVSQWRLWFSVFSVVLHVRESLWEITQLREKIYF